MAGMAQISTFGVWVASLASFAAGDAVLIRQIYVPEMVLSFVAGLCHWDPSFSCLSIHSVHQVSLS
jgi:hypothetical protein